MSRSKNSIYPTLPLRDVVVYPHTVVPLFVGRQGSILALDRAMKSNKRILLVAQQNAANDDPVADGVHQVGTTAIILQLMQLSDGTIKVLVEGVSRAKIYSFSESEEGFFASTTNLKSLPQDLDENTIESLSQSVLSQFQQYIKLRNKISPEIMTSLLGIHDRSQLADTVATHMSLKIEEKQKILEMCNVGERLKYIIQLIKAEIDLGHVDKRIRGRVKSQMEKGQREYYLNEQMKAIQKELGEMGDVPNEIDVLTKKVETLGMSKEAKSKTLAELNKLKMMAPMSAEATVVRNYIDWLLNVPWKNRSKISSDLSCAEQMLDEDHYGLKKVKERILEYLAVQGRVRKMKGPILCLVGPPGVGKTSLGKSIARATNRKFCRISLGGVRDEAEIRGHRKTYIGSMPGKIIQTMVKAGKKNPLFLLDEIDKLGRDYHGDPSAALLEVLDPEQNDAFVDHYLEVDYDLSDVMFVATANTLDIPIPLRDRMEIIRIAGYTEDEKINIASNYLVPKQIERNGLKDGEINIQEGTIRDIIRYYSREAGVRNLDREIANICRKVVKKIVVQQNTSSTVENMDIDPGSLEELIGVRHFRFGHVETEDRVGQVTGLAWTEVGGELLNIEAAVVKGRGKITRTGQLGDVMQESIEAAMTVVRSRSAMLGISEDHYKKHDFHVHVPEGATPKDGPSAGVAMCVSLVSVLTDTPVRASVAMTGEITLRGEILPIGGLKEKLLAALLGGIKKVLIPQDNARELVEIPDNIKQNLEIISVRWIDEVFELALQTMPAVPGGGEDKSDVLIKSETSESDLRKNVDRPHTNH